MQLNNSQVAASSALGRNQRFEASEDIRSFVSERNQPARNTDKLESLQIHNWSIENQPVAADAVMTPTSRKGPLTLHEQIPWAAHQSKTNPQQSRKRTLPLQLMSPDVQLQKSNGQNGGHDGLLHVD